MTLSTLASRVTYPGAGSVGPYAIPFRFTTALDLEVIVREANGNEIPLAYPTDFTVTGAGNAAGTLTLAVALAVGEILAIHRAPALTQATSIRNQGTYFPATIEDEFDRLVMQLQDLQDQLDRTFGVSSSFDPATLDLRLRPETGKALVWQSATELGNSSIVSSGVALPGAGRTVATLTAYLLNNQVYNVLDYGALGDGVTNDKAALKAAIAAAPASSTVWFPRTGQYYYVSIAAGENDAIDVNKKLTVIIDGTIQSSVGAIQPNPPTIFLVTGNDVTFGGSGVVRGEGTINALNAGIPAELPSLVKVTGNNFIWTGLTIDSPYKVGIHLYGAYHATITGARFTGGPVAYGSPGTTGYFAIRGEQGGRAIISNNQFYPGGLTGGMYVSCIFLNNCSWSVVDSNQAYRPYEKLVYGAMSYSVISNNVVVGRDPAAGAIPGTNQFGTLGPVYRCDGQYNKIIGNFSQYGGGAQSLGGIGLDVSGNTFLDCAQGGIGIIETGAVGAMNHMTVHNNLITCGNIPNTNIADGIYIRTPNNPPGYGPNRYLRVTNNTVTGFAVADPTVNFTIGNGGTRLPNTQYSVDTHAVRPTAGPNGFYYVAIVSGVTAGGGDPAWPVVALGTVVDGGVTWQAIDP